MKKNPDLSGLWLSPFVIAARMPILWFEAMNPDPRRRDETNRMVAEKLAAAREGMVAAQLALSHAVVENAAAAFFGQAPRNTPRTVADKMVKAGLGPAARRVKANHKRLASR